VAHGELITVERGAGLTFHSHFFKTGRVEVDGKVRVARWKNIWTRCRIAVRPFVNKMKAGQPARLKIALGEAMAQYLVAIHHPDGYDPFLVEDDAMARDIDVLNEEMIAAGVRVFAGGLQPASSATSLRPQPDGQVLISDGPYLEAKEHVGGFWVLETADLGEALAWGRKAVIACRAPVEVRPFYSMEDPSEATEPCQ
jgi:hypothetical protein